MVRKTIWARSGEVSVKCDDYLGELGTDVPDTQQSTRTAQAYNVPEQPGRPNKQSVRDKNQ